MFTPASGELPVTHVARKIAYMKHLLMRLITRTPIIRGIYVRFVTARFAGSQEYWRKRYTKGGTSGAGSVGKGAQYKARIVNDFVQSHGVRTVIELGCGDGNQLSLAKYPKYLGLDISPEAVALCRSRFRHDSSKQFKLMREYAGERADLALSLDVIHHLVEDDVFESYMRQLFRSSDRYVIIFSSNTDVQARYQAPHVRHRQFTNWISMNIRGWRLARHIRNDEPRGDSRGPLKEFCIYEME